MSTRLSSMAAAVPPYVADPQATLIALSASAGTCAMLNIRAQMLHGLQASAA